MWPPPGWGTALLRAGGWSVHRRRGWTDRGSKERHMWPSREAERRPWCWGREKMARQGQPCGGFRFHFH